MPDVRVRLSPPVQLNDGIGTTCDISTSGIFFQTKSVYSIGDTIRLLLNFEAETLQCEGCVVRVEPRNGQFGVAVALMSYVFVENKRVVNADRGQMKTVFML